ncbi:hypothetical protein DXG03_005211 [Asterophora parasitica]|uniref:Uncharacterized protein n=1 Tax=Asterophora parasitica TaxID=117018 RepID=A0A9P7G253_9AGAR|nr:hypothetical protein DXG03_005211 [Asterophora parasitica]
MATLDQQNLTERLLIIRGLGVRRITSPSFYYDSNTKLDLRMLNLIATCLTTGRSEGVAAAFDKNNGIRLILAKAGPILPTDLSATTEFLTALTEVEHWIYLLPFLVRHTKDNMDNRVRRLHESIVEVFDDLLSAAAGYSLDRSLEREFPYSDSFRRKYPDGQPPSLLAMLQDLIHSCRNKSLPFDLSAAAFLELYIVADTFRRSRFMRGFIDRQPLDPLDFHSTKKKKIARLQRRLVEICQYDGLELLMKRVRQVGSIPFQWVGDEFARSGVVEISPTALCAVERQTGLRLKAEDLDDFFVSTGHIPRPSILSKSRANAAVENKIAYQLADSPLGFFGDRD